MGIKSPLLTRILPSERNRMSVGAFLSQICCCNDRIEELDRQIAKECRELDYASRLREIPGCGPVLSSVIASEIGSISRFPAAANFVSYCRLSSTSRLSNGKSKGLGNAKNGNAHLSWAFTELANMMARYDDRAGRYYNRLLARYGGLRVKAIRVMAAKIARSVYQCLSKNEPYDVARCF